MQYFLPLYYTIDVCFVREQENALTSLCISCSKKDFRFLQGIAQGLHVGKMLTVLRNFVVFSFNFITNLDTKYNVYMYIQIKIELKIENVTFTKNVSM